MELGLKLGLSNPVLLGNEDLCSAKNCSLKLYDSFDIPVLYSVDEIQDIKDTNAKLQRNNDVIESLFKETKELVCYYLFCVVISLRLSYFVLCYPCA